MTTSSLLKVKNLATWIGDPAKPIRAVDGVDFSIQRGETFALLGESGCGKSMTALSLLRLNPQPVSQIVSGQAELNGQDLLTLSEEDMQHIRGRRIAMIFQEPQSSLNPVLTVGQQIAECLDWHFDLSDQDIELRTINLLESVGIPDPIKRIRDYPHQLSGGMKQRVMIAIALAGEPELLIADEPTTALDVTIQAQILDLLKQIQRDTGMAILLISHDLAVVAQMADHVAVMYAGQIVEVASREQFFTDHKHPYTTKLFDALPTEQKREQRLTVIKGNVPELDTVFTGCRFADRCDSAWQLCHDVIPEWYQIDEQGVRCHLYAPDSVNERANKEGAKASPLSEIPPTDKDILSVTDLKVHFPIKKGVLQRITGHVRAVDGVNLSLKQAETVALVGESGCGKTTVGKAILGLVPTTDGQVFYRKQFLNELSERKSKIYRNSLQIIFQDPYSSMNPRMTISQVIEEAMISQKQGTKSKEERAKRVDSLLERVGLRAENKYRYPHEFSGGQRQRICIARALAADPEVLICDEPTSALDVSVQAQILNLLREIQHEFGLSYLFITHNISVVEYLAQRIAVMYLGRIVEQGNRDDVLKTPKHPYTQALLAAVPKLEDDKDKQVIRLEGELPSPAAPPTGCHFHQRCPHVMDKCKKSYPQATVTNGQHEVRCFLY